MKFISLISSSSIVSFSMLSRSIWNNAHFYKQSRKMRIFSFCFSTQIHKQNKKQRYHGEEDNIENCVHGDVALWQTLLVEKSPVVLWPIWARQAKFLTENLFHRPLFTWKILNRSVFIIFALKRHSFGCDHVQLFCNL